MSAYRYATEAERRQAQQDHRFVWGVIENDPNVLSQLPPGPVVPGTFLHFLQQGDFSNAALAEFDPEALQIVQSLRKEIQDSGDLVLRQWHAEWAQNEEERKEWVTPPGPLASRSLLLQPAEIDVRVHEKTARDAALDYWGSDEEAPAGTRGQKARWETEAHAARHFGNKSAQIAPDALSYHPNNLDTRPGILQTTYGQSQQLTEGHQHQLYTTKYDQKRGYY